VFLIKPLKGAYGPIGRDAVGIKESITTYLNSKPDIPISAFAKQTFMPYG
jgi:hypothetical protein